VIFRQYFSLAYKILLSASLLSQERHNLNFSCFNGLELSMNICCIMGTFLHAKLVACREE